MLTCTLRKVSRILFSCFSFLDFANLLRKCTEGTLGNIGILQVTLGAKSSSFSITKSSCYFISSMVDLALFVASSSCFLLLKVTAIAFSLRLIMVWDGSFPEACALNLLIILASWLTYVSKLLMFALFFVEIAKNL